MLKKLTPEEKKLAATVAAAEGELWRVLKHRSRRFPFVRVKNLAGRRVEFYCAAARLFVEIDFKLAGLPAEGDAEREKALSELGIEKLPIHCGQVLDAKFDLGAWIDRACEARARLAGM